MRSNVIYIKNMVCHRCILVVNEILQKTGITALSVKLGEVLLNAPLEQEDQKKLEEALHTVGFELIDNRRIRLIELVKGTIIELVHTNNNQLKTNLSDYLSEKTHHDYTYLSNLFSEIENITIEKYFIAQKIERVKELLVYDELTLNEIADMLNYSSTAHLSSQFKKITGLTPSHFKKIKENKRTPLDKV